MARLGIFGGGIAGLAAAWECEQQRRAGAPLDWFLYEASHLFGGLLSTTRHRTDRGEYILEDGPDGWLTEKPWAAELALELGLGDEIIACNEAQRRTLLWLNGKLVAMPDHMRLMVPEDLTALQSSPLFTPEARQAYATELTRAEELRKSAPDHDESVANFVRRHFGPEVLARVAAPLLAGIFGGDVEQLSVRAVMPNFVALERDAGSLIAGLQARARMRGNRPPQPTFTTLRRGMGTLAEALVAALPPERLLGAHALTSLQRPKAPVAPTWLATLHGPGVNNCLASQVPFDHVLLATPLDVTRNLLRPLDSDAAELIPAQASSALLVTLCWPPEQAHTLPVPHGFGFLVPPHENAPQPELLAATFAEQKYPHRAPAGARIVRAFFGDRGSAALKDATDERAAQTALNALVHVLGSLPNPDPALTTVRRWPRSLPQYEVGHLDRMAELAHRIGHLGHLHLLGNAYHGVGVPDLIRDARHEVRDIAAKLAS